MTLGRCPRPSVMMRLVAFALGGTLLGFTTTPTARATPSAPPPITTVRALRDLPPGEAAAAQPVRIRGVITFYDPWRHLAFVQDETGGVYFHPARRPAEAPGLSSGDLVEIEGLSSPGGFAPMIMGPNHSPIQVRPLGRTRLPAPVALNPRSLLDPSLDALWVETRGVVRQVGTHSNRITLDLTNGFEDFSVQLPSNFNAATLPSDLEGSDIQVRGVYGSLADASGRLVRMRIYCPGLEHLLILDSGAAQAFNNPPLKASELLHHRPGPSSRVRVQGIVTASFPGEAYYLRVDGDPLQVVAPASSHPEVGSHVDVVGFPLALGHHTALHTAVFRPSGPAGPRPPARLLPAGLSATPRHHADWVQVEARLLDKFHNAGQWILLASNGGETFPIRFQTSFSWDSSGLLINGWFRFTGICLVDQEPPHPTPSAAGRSPTFSILLEGPQHIELLRPPPFWTTERILAAVILLVLALALSFLWVFLLKRKVAEQTATISAQIEAERVGQERTRIARELHDSLEQELAGIGLQLDLARSRAHQNPERVQGALDLALRMLRRTQQETRRSIQDLRSGLLEMEGLASALRQTVRQLNEEPGPPIHDHIRSGLPDLPADAEHNLLRVAQEALHNARRHSGAETIHLTLDHHPGTLLLEIRDNGRGFNPSHAPTGHFGLQGMKERALKLGAEFSLETGPDSGTTIRVQLPLPS